MRVKLKTGSIAQSNNPLVCEQWKKAGLRDLDAKNVQNEPKKPEIDPQPQPEAEKKPKRSRKRKPAEPLPPIPEEAENILKVMPKPEPAEDEEAIMSPGELVNKK